MSVESPRIMEAIAGYWQQIGLSPEISTINWNTYLSTKHGTCKTAGSTDTCAKFAMADMMVKVEIFLMPNNPQIIDEDESSYAIYQNNAKGTIVKNVLIGR